MDNPITPHEASLIQSSFHLVDTHSLELTNLFYKTLFERKPEQQTLFPSDMGRQKKKLLDTLNILVNGCLVMHKLIPAIKALGETHKPFNATGQDYEWVKEALTDSLEAYCKSNWTHETSAAWRKIFDFTSKIMMSV